MRLTQQLLLARFPPDREVSIADLVDPTNGRSMIAAYRMLEKMVLAGLLVEREVDAKDASGGFLAGMRWSLTDAGRAALAERKKP